MMDKISKQTLYSAILIVVLLVWTLAYALPRLSQVRAMRSTLDLYSSQKRNVVQAINEYSLYRSTKVAPQEGTSAWLASHVLADYTTKLDCNNPYKNGQGAQVKLRKVTAEEVGDILVKLTEVNLIVKSFTLEDRDGDGNWELEFMVEVPQ